jgi:hypothetical protein
MKYLLFVLCIVCAGCFAPQQDWTKFIEDCTPIEVQEGSDFTRLESPTLEDCDRIFDFINQRAYGGKLEANLVLNNKLPRTTLGKCIYEDNGPPTIQINADVHKFSRNVFHKRLWETIAHEMAHVKINRSVEKEAHGPLWKAEYERVLVELDLNRMSRQHR